MIAPLLLITAGALAASPPTPAPARQDSAPLAPGEARATVTPLDAGVGPARVGDRVLLRVEAASASGVALQGEPGFDVALEALDRTASHGERGDGARVDAFEWTLRVLGAGPLESGAIPTPAITLAAPGGAPIEVAPIEIEIAPAFGEDEVAPRPVPGFREVEGRRVGDPAVALLVLGLALLLPLAGLAFTRVRAARRAGTGRDVPRPSTPRERLRDLDPGAAPSAAVGALAPLVRSLVDAARGVDDGALTDEEWAERVRAGRVATEDLAERAAALVLESSAVRYAGPGAAAPTAFAARDAKARAEGIADELERVDAAPAAGAPVAADAGEVRP